MLRPPPLAPPVDLARDHVAAVADAEQEHALGPVLVFVQLPGRVDDERAGVIATVVSGVRMVPPPSKQK
jgi:hypothetical protein